MADSLVSKEGRFKNWYSWVSQALNIDPDPDPLKHQYDYRGYFDKHVWGREADWKKQMTAEFLRNPDWHFSSEFKLNIPGAQHPTWYLKHLIDMSRR